MIPNNHNKLVTQLATELVSRYQTWAFNMFILAITGPPKGKVTTKLTIYSSRTVEGEYAQTICSGMRITAEHIGKPMIRRGDDLGVLFIVR